MTLESAIRVVQLNERGRQGRQRAKFMKEIRSLRQRIDLKHENSHYNGLNERAYCLAKCEEGFSNGESS